MYTDFFLFIYFIVHPAVHINHFIVPKNKNNNNKSVLRRLLGENITRRARTKCPPELSIVVSGDLKH